MCFYLDFNKAICIYFEHIQLENLTSNVKPRASVFRATYLTIMNEDRVAAIPNWRVGDTTFLPKHMVPAPCQKEKMEIEDCMSEASISYTQTRKKVGDIPIANSHIAVHPICRAWEMLNESTA